MGGELIKLKFKSIGLSNESEAEVILKFLEACKNLDTSIFEPMIHEDQIFQEKDKYSFLKSLKVRFDASRRRGNEKLEIRTGKCQACHPGKDVYEFYGKNKTPEFAYIVHRENGSVEDVFLCNLSTGWGIVKTY
jgi:hypothetical protein